MLTNEATEDVVDGFMDAWTCTCFIYLYIVPPLGAYKPRLGGHISYRCCFIRSMSTVIIPLSLYIYIYCYFSFFVSFYCWCFCTSDAFHIRIRNDCSEKVCVCVCVKCRFTMLYPYLSVLRRKTRWDDGRCPDCRPKFHIQFLDSRSLVTVCFVKSVHFFSNMGKKKVKPWSKNLPQRV